MKKRKFNLFLNVAIICLCVCAIAIGVYSAKNASLNVSGSVGFNAHNCDVDVMAYIYGDSATDNTATAEPAEFGVVRTQEHKKLITTKPVEVKGNNDKTIDLKTFYFCDMTDNDTISPITIEFVLTNQSLFDVDASIKATTIKSNGTDIKYIDTKASQEITLGAKGSAEDYEYKNQDTLTLTLTLNQETSITDNPTISIILSMYKAEQKTTLSVNWNNTDENGLFNPDGYTFDNETIYLENNRINYLKFTRDEPDLTYKKVNNLNLADTSTSENPINVYLKKSEDNPNLEDNPDLYDLVIYSESKIYAQNYCWFNEWYYLSTVIFDNFDTSNVTNMYSMFNSCESLTSLDLSNFDTSKVTDMSSMFSSCSSLTSLDLSNFDTSKVTIMSNMFSSCSSLTSLDLSDFDTSNVTNMISMFYSCSSLTSLDLSNFNTSKVTSMWSMFDYCLSLTSLDLSNFDTSNVESMRTMFNHCEALTCLDLSNFDTSKVINMSTMFDSCSSLTTIFVSSYDSSTKTGWCIDNVTSSYGMFSGCGKLAGSAGTKYDPNKTDKTYARIDGGTSAPGYLTKKN